MQNKETHKLHVCLANLIAKHGERFPKKHGDWILLKIGENYFFELDTWNKSINWCMGKPIYNEWTGFSDKHNGFEGEIIKHIGIDFGGGFNPNATIKEYKGFIFIIENQKP